MRRRQSAPPRERHYRWSPEKPSLHLEFEPYLRTIKLNFSILLQYRGQQHNSLREKTIAEEDTAAVNNTSTRGVA